MKEIIRSLRLKNGMTTRELAAKAGVSRTTIWKLETCDNAVVTTKTLDAVMRALGSDLSAFFKA